MSGCHSEAGRLFQILGPVTEKLPSPSRVFSEQWGCRCEESEAGGIRSPRSAGSRWPGTMELDLAATCRREWPAIVDPLLYRKPVQATKNWDVVASVSSPRKAPWHILDRLQMLKQTVTDAVEQSITVIQTVGYECLDSKVPKWQLHTAAGWNCVLTALCCVDGTVLCWRHCVVLMALCYVDGTVLCWRHCVMLTALCCFDGTVFWCNGSFYFNSFAYTLSIICP